MCSWHQFLVLIWNFSRFDLDFLFPKTYYFNVLGSKKSKSNQEKLGWCPIGVSLTSWVEGASLALVGHPSFDSVKNKNATIKITLWGKYSFTLTSLAPRLFLLGLVKTKFYFIIRSVETDLWR